MGAQHSTTQQQKKEKVERLFRQNNRSNRSRSLDTRQEAAVRAPTRAVGSSHSARFPKTRCIVTATSIDDGPNGSISGLSRDEKRLLEVCWFKCSQKQLNECAEAIFYSILQTDEELLILFKLESVPMNRIRDNEYFKSHAVNLALVLNSAIANMQENFPQVCDALQTLGQSHLNLRDRGFQMMYWDIFTDCFERNHPPTFRKPNEIAAWGRLILFILGQMKIGYQRGLVDDRKNQLFVPGIS